MSVRTEHSTGTRGGGGSLRASVTPVPAAGVVESPCPAPQAPTGRPARGRTPPAAERARPARGNMQIHTDLVPAGPYDDVVVLIDVLRTGTLAPMLLDNGLSRFALTGSVRRARQEADADPSVLLMGEKGGCPPERFNPGTSPAALRRLDVKGRSAVIPTENAPRALPGASSAPTVVLASLLNARAAAQLAPRRSRGKVYLICSGFAGDPDLDDAIAAGLIAGLLRDLAGDVSHSGATAMSVAMLRSYPDPIEALW